MINNQCVSCNNDCLTCSGTPDHCDSCYPNADNISNKCICTALYYKDSTTL